MIMMMIISVIIITIKLKIVNHQPRNRGLIEMKDKVKKRKKDKNIMDYCVW